MVTVYLWHHKLKEVLTACFKAEFLNSGCVHFSVDWAVWYIDSIYIAQSCFIIKNMKAHFLQYGTFNLQYAPTSPSPNKHRQTHVHIKQSSVLHSRNEHQEHCPVSDLSHVSATVNYATNQQPKCFSRKSHTVFSSWTDLLFKGCGSYIRHTIWSSLYQVMSSRGLGQ